MKDESTNINLDAANEDWIRSARLKKKAEAGDEQARKKLEELFNKPTYTAEEINKRRSAEPDPEWDDDWGENPFAKKPTTDNEPLEDKLP